MNTPYSKMAALLVIFCLLTNLSLLPRLNENILLNFEFKNEATRANLHVNKRKLIWRPFWNKAYGSQMVLCCFLCTYRAPLVTVSDRKGFSSNVAILLLYSSLE